MIAEVKQHHRRRSSLAEMFPSPTELLVAYDDDINSGVFNVYGWQRKAHLDFANGDYVRMGILAANGSGKSQFVLAPCATWNALAFEEAQVVVTSSSGGQLDKQAARKIKSLAHKINFKSKQLMGFQPWDVQYRQLKFNHNEQAISYIDLFATDEAGKAEGWHPIRPGGEFSILVDEGKSIDEEIYKALYRCNGCNRRMDISSPGGLQGHFYDICTQPELEWLIHKVTAFDCPHITDKEINDIIKKYGLHDPLVRSSLFAEFSSVDEAVVIRLETFKECQEMFVKPVHFGIRAGLDLAAGGDENVLSVWDGNVQIGQETFRFTNTMVGARHSLEAIRKYPGLLPENINADDGGIGRGIIDNLHEMGCKVNRVMNQWRAQDNTRYANLGTENWFKLKRFVEEKQVKFFDDKVLKSQLTSRYYKQQQPSQKLILESKPEAKKHGHPSPDRADAAVLAWCKVPFPMDSLYLKQPVEHSRMDLEELARLLRQEGTDRLLPRMNDNKDRLITMSQRQMVRRDRSGKRLTWKK